MHLHNAVDGVPYTYRQRMVSFTRQNGKGPLIREIPVVMGGLERPRFKIIKSFVLEVDEEE